MENLTQQQIEELIQFIDEAEEPATVTNTIVAAVLAFLAGKIAGTATSQALLEEIAARQTADTNLSTVINQLQQLIQSRGSVVYLDSMGELDGDVDIHVDTGMVVYDPENDIIKKYTSPSQYESISCDAKLLYCNKVTGYFYRYSTHSGMQQVGGGGSGTSSSLVSQIISNIDLVNGRINTLIDDLAGLAFTGAKTAKTELDWDGTKVTVSLNTSGLSGCRVQETFPKQVLEGSSATITIVPTNDSHLLRNASYKIGANGEAHEVAISGNKAVINLSRINENITVYLTASAKAKDSFTASISDSRVSGTGATSGIAEGSAWLSQLSLNNTAEEGASITSITATMEGGGTINVSGNIVSTNNVTGNIHITATVAVVGRVSLSFPALSSGVKITDNNNNNAVVNDGVSTLTLIENSSISWKIGAIEGYRLSGVPSIQVESGQAAHSIVPTDNGDGTYSLSIAHVTGNVVITALAEEVVTHNVTGHFINMESDGAATIDSGENYVANLSPSTGTTSNDDLRVFVDREPLTLGTDYTFSGGTLTIPAAKITGDIDIVATASSGKIKITLNAPKTIYIGDNGTSTAHELVAGVNEISVSSLTKLSTVSSYNYLMNCTEITAIDFGGVPVNMSTMASMFKNCSNLVSISNLIFLASLTSLESAFESCKCSSIDLSCCNPSGLTSMNSAFVGCSLLSDLKMPLGTSGISSLNNTFRGAVALAEIDMKALKSSLVTSISGIFYGMTSLRKADISGLSGTLANISWCLHTAASDITLVIGALDFGSVSDTTYHNFAKVKTLICTTTMPPDDSILDYTTNQNLVIYVPDSAVNTYKSVWSSKANIIFPISDYVEPSNN